MNGAGKYMLDNYYFDLGVWYMTKDYKDLYKITHYPGDIDYRVIKYYDGEIVFSGSLYNVQLFMSEHCTTHEQYIRWCMINGK